MKNKNEPLQNATVERILHSATLLFSERGFTETSLRTITSLAEVNLASVNYHFGSKRALIQAVFARFLSPLSKALDEKLDELDQDAEVEQLLRAVFESLFKVTRSLDEDPQRFMRLLSLAYAQAQEHLRHFIVENYGATYSRFMQALRLALPSTSTAQGFWNSYFMLGAAVFTLSSYEPIRSILVADFDEDSSMEDVVELLIPAMERILTTPIPSSAGKVSAA